MSRKGPSKGFLAREYQRLWLSLHFGVFLLGMIGAFFANRFWTPEVFWVQWVALGWGLLLTAHGVVFARETLVTMGAKDQGDGGQ